jgi:hypothetical protein
VRPGDPRSLGTPWGLFRHYWVLIKLLITVAATALLMLHTGPIGYMAEAAAEATLAPTELHAVRLQLMVDAGAALGALLVTTVLGVYKPLPLSSLPPGPAIARVREISCARNHRLAHSPNDVARQT